MKRFISCFIFGLLCVGAMQSCANADFLDSAKDKVKSAFATVGSTAREAKDKISSTFDSSDSAMNTKYLAGGGGAGGEKWGFTPEVCRKKFANEPELLRCCLEDEESWHDHKKCICRDRRKKWDGYKCILPEQQEKKQEEKQEPTPEPEPKPQPKPEPKPVPVIVPEPAPAPAPKPKPQPKPEPKPVPVIIPEPAPAPVIKPDPTPKPKPEPAPKPAPTPDPKPEPDIVPTPEPDPVPDDKPEDCYYEFNSIVMCANGAQVYVSKRYPLSSSQLNGVVCEEFKKNYTLDTQQMKELTDEYCSKTVVHVDITPESTGPSDKDIESAQKNLKKFTESAKSNASVWKNAEGKFNTARLASDLTAGVVLGTVGGVVSGVVIKKKQVEKGFEALHCTVGNQKVADWGDEFTVGLRR